MLMDRAALKLLGTDFDDCGKVAASGKADEEWLGQLLENAYYDRVPPKTTGRELFGYAYADELLAQAAQRKLSSADVLATLTKIDGCLYRTLLRTLYPAEGRDRSTGGWRGWSAKRFLDEVAVRGLAVEVKIGPHEEFGVSTKFKEALLFALLAYTTFFQIPNNVPACTGARQRVCLGKLVTAPPAAAVV